MAEAYPREAAIRNAPSVSFGEVILYVGGTSSGLAVSGIINGTLGLFYVVSIYTILCRLWRPYDMILSFI